MTTQQNQARSQTERKIAAIEREILAVYDDARKAINLEIQALYAKALSGVAPEDYYNTVIQRDRLGKLQASIDKLYGQASIKAGRLTVAASKTAMNDAYYKNQYIMTWFSPSVDVALDFTLLPPELVNLSVTGNLANWQSVSAATRKKISDTYGTVNAYSPQEGSISALLANNRRDELLKINRAISSGLIQGNSYTKTAKAVAQVIGVTTKEGVTGAKASSMRVVRTESNRTYNSGAFANTQAVVEQGLEVKRVWVATLDQRTRDRHASLDGQTVGPDEPFTSGGESAMFPGDFPSVGQNANCRCTAIDAVDGIPPQARRGVNPQTGEYEVFDWATYGDWAKANGV